MNRKLIVLLAVFALAGSTAFAQTATKYFVAHQGGYVAAATVTVGKSGEVVSAAYEEYQGPGGWAENNSPKGDAIVDGAAVRVPDPFGNLASADPAVKGYTFYILSGGVWVQYAPGKDAFAKSTNVTRDFDALMGNPLRAAAYVKAAREDSLVNIKTDGLKVIVGKKASETVHYGAMNKADKNANYMSLAKDSIGYRYNYLATVSFFKKHPTADFAAATLQKAKITLVEDRNVDAAAKVADYVAATDDVYVVADVVTGATYTDFQHYSLELQTAYKMAIADALVKF